MTPDCSSIRPWLLGFGLTATILGAFLLIADHPGEIAEEVAKRVADGKKPRAESDFALGLWWAALANLVLCGLLAAGVKLWARRLPAPASAACIAPGKISRTFLVALLAAMALGGALRWPLAHRSLWWDELWAAKYGVVGYYIGDGKTPLEDRRFGEATWRRALWHYTRPMNHPAASFPARLSHVVWKKIVHPPEPHSFSDFALRLPNWLASLAAIGAIGAIGSLWGRPLAGATAALLLAIHPWHIRYGVDLRGYSWLILWTAMGLIWLTLMLRSDRVRWWPWWAFGINQALLVWSFPHGGAAVAVACFAVFALLIPRFWPDRKDRATAWLRLLLVNVVAAMLYLQIFGPNLLQMLHWWKDNSANHVDHSLNGPLLKETLASLVGGSRHWVPAMALLIACIAGIVAQLSRHLATGWLLAAPLIGGMVLLGCFSLSDAYFYPRFLTFLLIPYCLGIGLFAASTRFSALAGLAVGCLIVPPAVPLWKSLMERPYAPMRDVAEVLNAGADHSIVVCYGHGSEMLPLYAPSLRDASSLAEIKALAAEAAATGKGLLIACGYEALGRRNIPDGYQWLDDTARFETIGTWHGLDPEFTFRVLRWTGAAD